MRAPAFPLDVETDDALPLYVRIGQAIAADIRRGRLRPGDALPGSRELATSLGVHRNTVLAAIRELVSEGYLTTQAARGTFVATEVPEPSPRAAPHRRAGLRTPCFSLPTPLLGAIVDPPASSLALAGGIPDIGLVPREALARAYRSALLRHGEQTLSYGDPRGEPTLREAIAKFVAQTRSLPCSADEVLVTRGSQMALFLTARALLEPGDAVAVEALGYRPAWDALRLAGARLVPIPVDAGGLDVAALDQALSHGRIRAVYLTPHHQYPTTVALAPARRRRLLALAASHDFAVLEDDYDHEFHYDGRPLAPVASLDREGSVVYFGTFSKVVAPGLRAGFVVAPTSFINRLADLRRIVDRQGDRTLELALADLLEDGTIARHVRRARRIYERRRDAFVDELRARFDEVLRFTVPPGGTALFAEVDRSIDVGAWTARAADRGLTLFPGARFSFDGREPGAMRLGFAQLDDEQRARTLTTLAASRPVITARRSSRT
jgi:GntR family transcriptional regulator/MocR family aminotransferase